MTTGRRRTRLVAAVPHKLPARGKPTAGKRKTSVGGDLAGWSLRQRLMIGEGAVFNCSAPGAELLYATC